MGAWRYMETALCPELGFSHCNTQISLPDYSKKTCWMLIFSQVTLHRAAFCHSSYSHLGLSHPEWDKFWGCTLQFINSSSTIRWWLFPLTPSPFFHNEVLQVWFWTQFSWYFAGCIFFTNEVCHDRSWINSRLSYSWILKLHIMKCRSKNPC